jgi:hypothetical protein
MEALLKERIVLLGMRPANKDEKEWRQIMLSRIKGLLCYYRKKAGMKDIRNERAKQYYQIHRDKVLEKVKLKNQRRNMTRAPQQYIKRGEEVEEAPQIVYLNFCLSFE